MPHKQKSNVSEKRVGRTVHTRFRQFYLSNHSELDTLSYNFFLTMTITVTSQNTDLSSWIVPIHMGIHFHLCVFMYDLFWKGYESVISTLHIFEDLYSSKQHLLCIWPCPYMQILPDQYTCLYLKVHFENGRNHWLTSVSPINFCSSDSCYYQNKLFIYDYWKLRNIKAHMIFLIMCFFYQNWKIETSSMWKVQGLCLLLPHVVLSQF